MANDRHTWVAQLLEDGYHGYPDWRTYTIRDATTNVHIATVGHVDRFYEADIDNHARLIAAAPDMAAALNPLHSSVGALLEVYEDVDTNAERLFEAFATMADTLRRERLAARAALEKAGL